jgi:hypothetical protein
VQEIGPGSLAERRGDMHSRKMLHPGRRA